MFFKLAFRSLLNRKGSVLMALLAISVGIFVLLGVEHIRKQARDSFASTVSGVDLIVGARTGSLNLLLYSVFRIGAPTNNISWESYQAITSGSGIDWAIPISLGDSHEGYRVIGTTDDYFKHFRYGDQRQLKMAKGEEFESAFDVVLGSEVARRLNYELGARLVLAHGVAKTSFAMHDDSPFTVSGILAPTGTPVDQTLHVSLAGIEAIHLGWQQGVKLPGNTAGQAPPDPESLQAESITAFMLGLKSRITTFRVQRDINNYAKEPLMAILPGVALSELWQMMGMLENTLRLISGLVLFSAVLGLGAMLLASIRERGQEIQLLRVIGASPLFLFFLIELEAVLVCVFGIALGALSLHLCLLVASDYIMANFGLSIGAAILTPGNLVLLLSFIAISMVVAAIPSFAAYRRASPGGLK